MPACVTATLIGVLPPVVGIKSLVSIIIRITSVVRCVSSVVRVVVCVSYVASIHVITIMRTSASIRALCVIVPMFIVVIIIVPILAVDTSRSIS